jgi:DNA mismatch endonuclease, patch repair protein
MRGIRARNTRPEMRLRSALHRLGFRFRLHARELPGKPDLILRKHRAVVLVHGCFWHRHTGCRLASIPASNAEFWVEKFTRNVERDRQVMKMLVAAGWRVAIVWECGLRSKDISGVVDSIKQWLISDKPLLELP